MTVTIRPATHDDLDALLALRELVAAEGIWIGGEVPLDLDRDRARSATTIDADPGGASSLAAVVDDRTLVGNLSIHQPTEPPRRPG